MKAVAISRNMGLAIHNLREVFSYHHHVIHIACLKTRQMPDADNFGESGSKSHLGESNAKSDVSDNSCSLSLAGAPALHHSNTIGENRRRR